jgi:hypothetical protein
MRDVVRLLLAASVASFVPQDVPRAKLVDIQASLMVRVPDLPAPRCPEDPETHVRCVGEDGQEAAGIVRGRYVFTPKTNVYPRAQRDRIYRAYIALGLTHFVVNLDSGAGRSYHDIYPAPVIDANTFLREIWSRGLIPIVAVLDDGSPPPPLNAAARAVDRSLVPIVFGQWEHPQADCQLKATREAFPDALLYWETPGEDLSRGSDRLSPGTPLPDACSPNPYPQGRDWFRHAQKTYGLHGVFVETTHWDDSTAAIAAIQRQQPAWQDLQGVLFETDAYPRFWKNYDDVRQREYNDRIRRAIPWLSGFASGGTPGSTGRR